MVAIEHVVVVAALDLAALPAAVARGSPSWWRSTSPAVAVVAIEHVAVAIEHVAVVAEHVTSARLDPAS